MLAPNARDLYEQLTLMPVDERLHFFSLTLTDVHRELQDYIVQLDSMRRFLEESEENYRQLVDSAQDAVITIDLTGRVIHWNRAAEKMFGWPASEAVGGVLGDLIVPHEHRVQHAKGLQRFKAEQSSNVLNKTIEITALHRSNGLFPIELSIWPHLQSGQQRFSAFIRDITDRKRREEATWNYAHFDALTGLPNRRLLTDRLEKAVEQAASMQSEVALLFIDLDRFKPVNDTYGHAVGDELLCLVASRLQGCLRKGDTVARLGGDEFIVLLPGLQAGAAVAQQVMRKITAALRQTFHIHDRLLDISGSVGIAVYPHDATQADALLARADAAMYAAKHKA